MLNVLNSFKECKVFLVFIKSWVSTSHRSQGICIRKRPWSHENLLLFTFCCLVLFFVAAPSHEGTFAENTILCTISAFSFIIFTPFVFSLQNVLSFILLLWPHTTMFVPLSLNSVQPACLSCSMTLIAGEDQVLEEGIVHNGCQEDNKTNSKVCLVLLTCWKQKTCMLQMRTYLNHICPFLVFICCSVSLKDLMFRRGQRGHKISSQK